MIPTYRSCKWIKEDWRILSIKNDKIHIGDQCKDKNHLSSSGQERLCLPLIVIKRMMTSKKNRDIIKKTIRKKATTQDKKVLLPKEINKYLQVYYTQYRKAHRPRPIRVSIKNNEIVKTSKKGILLDKHVYDVIIQDKSLKKSFVRYCKQKQIQKRRK
jgi:hypothetical protein